MSQARSSPAKRQRIGQACDPCRKRKSKCDGELPACLVCISLNRTCTYDHSSRRRGLQPGYVRGLETLLGILIREIPRGEQRIRALVRQSVVGGQTLENDSGEGASELWRQSGLSRDLEQLLSSSEDVREPCCNALSPINLPDEREGQLNDLLAMFNSSQQPELAAAGPANMHGVPRDVCEAPLPAETPDLVEFYFLHTHCWFPIVERRDILRIMHSESAVGDLTSSDRGFRACVWAIIALSLAQRRQHLESVPTFEQMLAHLQSQVAEYDQELELGHIQATLITVLLRIGWGHFHAAWILVGKAARMLLVYKKRPPRYDHTCRGCLILDVFLSALLGHRPFFPLDDQIHLGQLDEDSLDEWEPWSQPSNKAGDEIVKKKSPLRALSSFNLVAQLMQRLTRIIWHPTDGLHHQGLIDDLQSWKGNLPGHHKLQGFHLLNPPRLSLHLMWNFVVCTLLEKAAKVGDPLMTLAEQTAGSTLEILQNYSFWTGATSPLLMGFAVQARSCLQLMSQYQPVTTNPSLVAQLDQAQDNLKQLWELENKNRDESAHAKSTERYEPTKATQQASTNFANAIYPAGNGVPSFPIPFGTVGGFENRQESSSSFQPQFPFNIPGNILESDRPPSITLEPSHDVEGSPVSAADQFSETIDFDTLFEEMSSFMSIKRPNQQSGIANNLGFVTDNLDPDFSAFLYGETNPPPEALKD